MPVHAEYQSTDDSSSPRMKTMKKSPRKDDGESSDYSSTKIACDLFHTNNIAIASAYFAIGFVQAFPATPLNIYLVKVLNAEPQRQNTLGILQSLPWSMKLAFGFLSDAVPIQGLHRKPYFYMGAGVFSLSFIVYYLCARNDFTLLASCVFLGTMGLIQMDVMADTMCVERSKFEPEHERGHMQASCYSLRFAGNLLGAIMGATLCNRENWGWGLDFFQVSLLNGVVPVILVFPFLSSLKEKYRRAKDHTTVVELGLLSSHSQPQTTHMLAEEHSLLLHDQHVSAAGYHSLPHVDFTSPCEHTLVQDEERKSMSSSPPPTGTGDFEFESESDESPSLGQQINEIWQTVQLRSVWRPMTFVFIFNLFQVPNVAWQSYLQLSLRFPGWILGCTMILGSLMTFAGVLAYKHFFFRSSWRSIYLWTVVLTTFFSLLQLVLIFQWNVTYLHLNNYLFSLGDDVVTAYINGIQFLPLCIMYMRLCPEGAEGASYAMLTTFGNIALVGASNIGNALSGIWDVSNDALRAHNYDGLWRLNLLTSTLAVLPLALLFLLPKDAEEQEQLGRSKERSKLAGGIFLFVLIGSLLWNTTSALYRIFN